LKSLQAKRTIFYAVALTPSETLDSKVDLITAGVQHRQRLTEPEPQLASLSQREQRAILREKMGLPPM
jgi:hypothetical protein